MCSLSTTHTHDKSNANANNKIMVHMHMPKQRGGLLMFDSDLHQNVIRMFTLVGSLLIDRAWQSVELPESARQTTSRGRYACGRRAGPI